jgi:7-cyano-7-deazaguanine reductase
MTKKTSKSKSTAGKGKDKHVERPANGASTSADMRGKRAETAKKLYGQIAIENNELEVFDNRTLVRRYTIEFTCPEFTCLCPRSGFPDFATIRIKYVPHKKCVELKSLKLYINGFRDKHVFHEDVVNVILQDLIDKLDPWDIEVVGDFTVRGNIHTVVTAKHSKTAD